MIDVSRRAILRLIGGSPSALLFPAPTGNRAQVSNGVIASEVIATQAGTTAAGTALRVMTLQPAPQGKAPFTLEIGGAQFGSPGDPTHEDSAMYFGYNVANGGSKVVPSEPLLSFNIESQFLDGGDGGADTAEAYIEFRDTTGNFVTRPFMFNFRRTPGSVNNMMRQSILRGNPIQFQLPDMDTVFGQIDAGSLILSSTPASPDYVLRMDAAADGIPQLLLRQNGVDSFHLLVSNRNFSSVRMDGRAVLSLASYSSFQQLGIGSKPRNGVLTVDLTSMTAGGLYGLQSRLPAEPPASWNHQVWENGGIVQSRVSRQGYVMTRKRTAPVTGELANSELAIWLDDTAGATTVQFKAKDAAGTVRNGSVALA